MTTALRCGAGCMYACSPSTATLVSKALETRTDLTSLASWRESWGSTLESSKQEVTRDGVGGTAGGAGRAGLTTHHSLTTRLLAPVREVHDYMY